MTAIAALAYRGHIVIGADSAATDETGGQCLLRDPKIWLAAPGLVVGHAGSGPGFEALRWSVTWAAPRSNAALDAWAHRDLARILAPALGACRDDSIIVGCRGTLWTIDIESEKDDSAGRIAFNSANEPFAAIGSGGDPARAVLRALRGSKLTARAKVLKALEAAESCRSDVRKPFVMLEV